MQTQNRGTPPLIFPESLDPNRNFGKNIPYPLPWIFNPCASMTLINCIELARRCNKTRNWGTHPREFFQKTLTPIGISAKKTSGNPSTGFSTRVHLWSVGRSVCPSFRLSVCLSVCLSVFLFSICLNVSRSA